MNSFSPNQMKAIEAAIIEFQDNGFRGTSMSSIAKAAGMSKKELKTYFENKDWYIGKHNDVTDMMTDLEMSNIQLIKLLEESYNK